MFTYGLALATLVLAGQCRAQDQSDVTPRSAAAPAELHALAETALSGSPEASARAIRELRQQGPESVAVLLADKNFSASERWQEVLDAVAQQKGAQYCGLYWYTDLNEAMAVAQREKKPILSLRLLGKLTDELSCANSRYFRTTLYPNAAVRRTLSTQFVLHWQSMRNVPRITIDLGNGNKIERTITGNSLHMILDERGRPIDVVPGLYAAETFVQILQDARPVAIHGATMDGAEFQQNRAAYHLNQLASIQKSWEQACGTAGPLAIGTDHPAEIWTRIANVAHRQPVLDDDARRAVIDRAPPAEVAGARAFGKSLAETPMMRLVRNVSRMINEDSVRNEYHLHVSLHKWFAYEPAMQDREAIVKRTYAELFLSPLDDPWFGLSKPDIFSAIKNDGRIDAVTQNTGH
jgi:hypothetical protein